MARPGLFDRSRELGRIASAIAAMSSGRGSVLLVEGEAGIGKSALLASAVASAAANEVRVLSAMAGELDRSFAFGVVAQLFVPWLEAASEESVAEALAGAAAPARRAFPESSDPLDSAPQPPFAVLHGLSWLTANIAAERPLLIVVDDAHWADEPSLRFLEFLARRLDEMQVTVLLGARRFEARSREGALAGLARLPDVETLALAPLSTAGVAGMLAGAGEPEAVDADATSLCLELTGGNPFLVAELCGALQRERLPVSVAALRNLAEADVDLADTVGRRLARIDPDADTLAQALAVLESCRLSEATELSGLEPDAAAASLDELLGRGLVQSEPLRFSHPLLREAVLGALPRSLRAERHRAAARLLAERGAPADAIAAQLHEVPAESDSWAVGRLREAAVAAGQAGAPEVAVRHLSRCLAEPPPAEQRLAVLLELGLAEAQAGNPLALEHLDEALARSSDPQMRVTAGVALARLRLFLGQSDAALAGLEPLAAELGASERELALSVEAEIIDASWGLSTWPQRDAALERFSAALHEGDRLAPVLAVSRAYDLAASSHPATAVEELLLPALAGGRLLRSLGADSPLVYLASTTLLAVERSTEAVALLDAAQGEAAGRGSVPAIAYLHTFRAAAELRNGSISRAVAEARAGLDLVVEADLGIGRALACAIAIEALIEQGDLAQAEQALALAPDEASMTEHPFGANLLAARGRLALAHGTTERGVDLLRRCGEAMASRGWSSPGLVPWRSLLASALAEVGDCKEGASLATEELELARGIGRPRAVGVALRAIARCREGTERSALLDQSRKQLEDEGFRLELASTLAEIGRQSLAEGDPDGARKPLKEALDCAAAAGAEALVTRIFALLRETGARPRRRRATGPRALTPSERRVADLAAAGLSNREIADQLFLSIKTVETHLSNAFPKLGIRSRDRLAVALATDPND